ncbi:MAG: RdgB/HAM1 family non-canonical purine NTP pyrophosphatase [bacterium]
MKRLVIATHNRDKFIELKKELADLALEILPAFEFAGIPEVIEDGKSLEENSLKKAKEISAFTGLPTLADDTGLFVEALNGAPGIYAARFAGEKCSYQDNVRKILEVMREVPVEKRKAAFRTIVTLYFPGESPKVFEGRVEGQITTTSRGAGAFGYDPVFQPDGSDRVFAEMSLDEKNVISHRGLAVQKAKVFLSSWVDV